MLTRRELANAVRVLSMDAVQKANSGHPGAPMGMADIAEVLWNTHLSHNPADPDWVNRDRFVLSNGHASMLLYSLLHLSGYDVSMEDIKAFRQLHSKTPGHPEHKEAPGVETTTGPLGQGLSNAVGMAIAEKILAAQFNKPNFKVVDHHTYVFAGDGCLMEGISHEVCSLAGTLGLGKLILLWDDNKISIDGEVDDWFSDDTPQRFAAYGWQVISDVDGHNADAIHQAIEQAKTDEQRPTIICCKTEIAHGAPNKANTADAHGAPLGIEEIDAVRERLQWPHPPFEMPEKIYAGWDGREKGAAEQADWNALFIAYREQYPELADEFIRRMKGGLPENFELHMHQAVVDAQTQSKTMATRKSSQVALNQLGPILPEFMGGSADLTGSNCTNWSGTKAITPRDASGNYIHYGVREFGMSAIMNGLALHGGFIPYGGTFLTFSDYARNAVRMSALMKLRVIYVYSHDSIGLGEDGPTHQPIEHAAMLRMTPNLHVWRPCDTAETAVAWKFAVQRDEGPSALLLTRQNVPHQLRDEQSVADIARGAYILSDCPQTPEAVIIATGSEVAIAMEAANALTAEGRQIRVVSMPCSNVFDQQAHSYRDKVLPPGVTARVAIEAGVPDFWYKYVGLQGKVIGLDHFGASAPYEQLYAEYGLTVDNLTETVRELI